MSAVKLVGPAVDGIDTLASLTDRLGQLHRRYGALLRGVAFAVDQLAPHEQDTSLPRVARAHAVLRDALEEVSR